MSSFGRKLKRQYLERAEQKPWREGKKTWEPATYERAQEILRGVAVRGAMAVAEGRYEKPVMVFELDDVLELFGPPPHGLPITKDDLVDYIRRAQMLQLDQTSWDCLFKELKELEGRAS